MNVITSGSASEADAARKQLREELLAIAPVFGQKPFFLSDEFSWWIAIWPRYCGVCQFWALSSAATAQRAERLYDSRI